jgi:hypothetical protein
MKFEKLTIWVCTEAYRPENDSRGMTALDYVIPALDDMEGECKVLGYSTEDYTLEPKQKQEEEA